MSTKEPYWELVNRYGDVIQSGEIEFHEIESWTDAGVHTYRVISRDCLPELSHKGDSIAYRELDRGYDIA